METINTIVGHSYFPWGILGLFLIFLAWSVLSLKSRSKKAKTDLEEGISVLKEHVDFDQPEHSFTLKFQTIDQQMQNTGLRHYWTEFSETLIPPYEDIDSPEFKLYQNTKRPQDYFKAEQVFSNVRPLISSNTFVGVGLLLTFVGLIIALTFTGQLFNGGESEELVAGLQMLLATAGVKFVASVAGLGASLIQEVYFSAVRHKNLNLIDEFNELLEKSLVFANSESLTARQLAHSMKQTKELEIMADGIAVKIGDSVSAAINTIPMALSDELNKTFEPVVTSIAETASRIGDNNQDALSEMAKQFTDQISGASSQAF